MNIKVYTKLHNIQARTCTQRNPTYIYIYAIACGFIRERFKILKKKSFTQF